MQKITKYHVFKGDLPAFRCYSISVCVYSLVSTLLIPIVPNQFNVIEPMLVLLKLN